MSSFDRPLIVSGPSGVGKSTLLKLLFNRHGDKFGFSVSHTTRMPRPGEVDGEHYHFTDPETFISLRDNDKAFIETAQFASNYYGTSKQAVLDVQSSGRRCILDIEAQGVRQVKQSDLDPVYLFIAPPSIEELEARLKGRGTDEQGAVDARLKMAIEEIEYAWTGAHNFVVKNDDLGRAYEKFETVALGGEVESDELPSLTQVTQQPTPPTSGLFEAAQSEAAQSEYSGNASGWQ